MDNVKERDPDGRIVEMFDVISPSYDLANHVLSFGCDFYWRRRCVRALDLQTGQKVLDCSAGTGDLAIAVIRNTPSTHVVLLDPAEKMLARAEVKFTAIPQKQFSLVQGGAESLPFATESFDRVMVAFGIRNFRALDTGLAELFRVTCRGGKGAILEFTPDRSSIFKPFFRFYFSKVIQPVGTFLSGDSTAYRHLKTSIRDFPTSIELREKLERIGWTVSSQRKFSGGVVSLFIMEKA